MPILDYKDTTFFSIFQISSWFMVGILHCKEFNMNALFYRSDILLYIFYLGRKWVSLYFEVNYLYIFRFLDIMGWRRKLHQWINEKDVQK